MNHAEFFQLAVLGIRTRYWVVIIVVVIIILALAYYARGRSSQIR